MQSTHVCPPVPQLSLAVPSWQSPSAGERQPLEPQLQMPPMQIPVPQVVPFSGWVPQVPLEQMGVLQGDPEQTWQDPPTGPQALGSLPE